ncbi:MAG: GAF domain-containing protein [Bacteroidales bacterium]|nr:GAF domain-containing protein [Bacteroidales bacterium]HRX30676.1 HAMP domain-containing protein [Tenuifilaceae bacterium]
MNLRKHSIGKILKFTAISIVTSISIFTAIIFIQEQNSKRDRDILIALEHLYQNNLLLQKTKEDFLYRDIHNEKLYKYGYDTATKLHDSIINATFKELTQLDKEYKTSQIQSIKNSVSSYNNHFNELKELAIKRGFKDFGLEGELRNQIHRVEATINKKIDYRLLSDMLMLRRHEKDYIIRRDTSYIVKFDKAYKEALSYSTLKYGGETGEIATLLKNYYKLFHTYTDIDKQIGLNEKQAQRAILNSVSQNLAVQIKGLKDSLAEKINSQGKKVYTTILILVFVISALLLFILTTISRHISKTVKSIQKTIKKLGAGELPPSIKISGKDEFSGIEKSINELSTALRNTRDFAIEVGNGNFYSEVNVFGNSGELGSRLLEMRKKLLEVAREQEQNLAENKRRNWLNENLAKMANLLRAQYAKTEDLCFDFIRYIIKTTDALQGGVYLIKTDQESNLPHIDLTTSFALDRRKYLQKRFDIHEGLVGACIYEKDIIFITDIPKDYTHITTGLGQANPSCILLAPLITDMNEVIGCIEVASYKLIEPIQVEFIRKTCINLASAIKFNEMLTFNENIIAEMQQKNNELQSSEEELKQNMEELKTIRDEMERREDDLNKQIIDLKQKLNFYSIHDDSIKFNN